MVRPRTVSEWGPNAQGVRSRPDRSVSLGDVREQPVQKMGLGQGGAPGKFGGGYGVHTRISELDGEYRVRLFIDGEYQAGADYFTDDVAEAHETAKAMEEDAHLSDKDSDVARDEARDFVEDAIMRPDLDEVEVPEDLVADDARLPVEEMRGLTADEAFQQHHAARRIDRSRVSSRVWVVGVSSWRRLGRRWRLGPRKSRLLGSGRCVSVAGPLDRLWSHLRSRHL